MRHVSRSAFEAFVRRRSYWAEGLKNLRVLCLAHQAARVPWAAGGALRDETRQASGKRE